METSSVCKQLVSICQFADGSFPLSEKGDSVLERDRQIPRKHDIETQGSPGLWTAGVVCEEFETWYPPLEKL